MSRITFNKNVASSSGVTADKFSTGAYRFGEIVVCNDVNEPGLYIISKNSDGTSGEITKVNGSKSIRLEGAVDPSLATSVSSGDTLLQAVSKLQNQINSATGSSSDLSDLVDRIVVGVGLKNDGTYEAIVGTTYVSGATSVQDAIRLLDNAITQEVNDRKAAIANLDVNLPRENGKVFTSISEVDGLVSGGTEALTITKDDTGLIYTVKLGNYIIGEINIPQDQFLSGVTFISAATMADYADAYAHGQIIEVGKPYLKFVWKLTDGVISPTYIEVAALSKSLAKDINLSSEYTGNTFNIHSGITVEESIDILVKNLSEVSSTTANHKVESPNHSITINNGTNKTFIDVFNDDDTIVRSTDVSHEGRLSVKLDIEEQPNTDGLKPYLSKYILKSKTGIYGTLLDKRTFVEPITGSDGKWISSTRDNKLVEGTPTDVWKLGLKVQDDINAATGTEPGDNNGLITAYGVKNAINSLKVTDTDVNNQFVSSISEANGKISVSRKQLFDSFVGGKITSSGNVLTQESHTLSIGGNEKSAGESSCDIINSISIDSLNNPFDGALDISISVNGKTATKSLTGFNADKLGGYSVGNNNGQIPVSNGSLNTNLNADTVDGLHFVVGSTGTTSNTIYFL